MDVCVFEKIAGFYARSEIFLGDKMIILAIDLAGARRPRGAGNGVNEVGRLAQGITERRLPRA
jgi:hypothetical protein